VKKILFILITAAAAMAGVVFADPLPADKVPAVVRDAFRSKFPGVGEVEWKRKGDKTYEAEFRLKDVETAAKFDAEGKWLETETAVEPADLPKEVRAAVAKDFKDCKVIETQRVERADDKPTLFEVHLENADEILKVQFEGDGTVSSKSAKRKKGL
jgi:hypothetical protein